MLADALSTNDDLVAAELNDNKVIDATDLAVMNTGLTGVGKTHWRGGTLEKTGPGAIEIARTAEAGSEVAVPAGGQTLKISSGTFSAGGTADPFADSIDPARRVNIENNAVGGAGVGTSGFNVIAGSKSVGALAGTGTASVSAGATLVADYIRQDSLTLEGAVEVRSHGSNASIVNTLSINTVAGGRLDLGDNDMIVHSASVGTSVGSTYDGLSGLIQSGSNGGSWDGSGILTSRPDAATGLTSLGIATGAQTLGLAGGETGTWNGMAVSGADALVMYTYRGDANLDGFISGDDYSAIDFASATPGAFGWHNGDFNWDGIISGDDYSAIDFNLVAQGAPFPTAGGAAGAVAAVSAVPEPAAGLWMGGASAGAWTLFRRRRPLCC